MLQGEHSAKRLTFIKLPFVIKIFLLSIPEWLLKTSLRYQHSCDGLNCPIKPCKLFPFIYQIGYRPGSKNTAAALKYVRKRMFAERYGDRDFAKNYVIMLTGDEPSTDPFAAATEACRLQVCSSISF